MVEAYPERGARTDAVIAEAIVRDTVAALLRRIQFSYRPKQITLVEPGMPALAEMLRQTGLYVWGNATGGGRCRRRLNFCGSWISHGPINGCAPTPL